MLDDLKYITGQLLYKSGNKVVDDVVRNTQINCNLNFNMMEFVPYNQFEKIKLIAKVELCKIYKATWINGPILSWNNKELKFRRGSFTDVALQKLKNSKDITFRGLNEVHITVILINLITIL